MSSASFDVAWIDPFAKPRAIDSSSAVENPADNPAAIAAAAAAAAEVDPASLGIALGGIMSSPRGRVATINGEPYREGDQVSLADIYRSIVPFFFLMVLTIVILMVFPEIALWLPDLYRGP